MKIAIIGSRTFDDTAHLKAVMLSHFSANVSDWSHVTEVISGGAKGADKLGADWAREQGIKLTEYLPDWERYGKRAGFIRNEDIVKNADMVVSFWDSISKGTQNSLSIAKRLKIPTLVIYF